MKPLFAINWILCLTALTVTAGCGAVAFNNEINPGELVSVTPGENPGGGGGPPAVLTEKVLLRDGDAVASGGPAVTTANFRVSGVSIGGITERPEQTTASFRVVGGVSGAD